MRAAAFVVLAAAVAHADATVPADPTAAPLRCSYEDVALFREARSERVKQAQALAGPDVWFSQASAHHVLFTDRSSERAPPRAVLVDLDARTALKMNHGAIAFVENGAGRVTAMLARDHSMLRLLDGDGRVRWETVNDSWFDSAALATDGAQLFVTRFHRIATGSTLQSYDLASGRVLWTADVEQLNASHSKYYNDVTVEFAAGRVTLRGTEAYGCYVQTFDAATGRRLSSRIRKPR